MHLIQLLMDKPPLTLANVTDWLEQFLEIRFANERNGTFLLLFLIVLVNFHLSSFVRWF
jgi:hypothetical protein